MTLLPPTPTQQKQMEKELPPDPEMREQDIRTLRKWLSKQPHLPNHIGTYLSEIRKIKYLIIILILNQIQNICLTILYRKI